MGIEIQLAREASFFLKNVSEIQNAGGSAPELRDTEIG
jgi:hypothetical protein